MTKNYKVKKACWFMNQFFEYGEHIELNGTSATAITKRGVRIPLGELEVDLPEELFDVGNKQNQTKQVFNVSASNTLANAGVTRIEFKALFDRVVLLEQEIAKLKEPTLATEGSEVAKIEFVEFTEEELKRKFSSKELNVRTLSALAEKNFGKDLVTGGGKTVDNVIQQYLEAQKQFLEQNKQE